MRSLDEPSAAVLAAERRAWSSVGEKERFVREQLGLTVNRYYQLLNALIDDPAANAAEPELLGRLRRRRQQHSRPRSTSLPPESV